MAQSVDRRGVGQLVRQPEEEPQDGGRLSPADPGEEEEDDLQRKAQQHQDLDRPLVPKVNRPSTHICLSLLDSTYLRHGHRSYRKL